MCLDAFRSQKRAMAPLDGYKPSAVGAGNQLRSPGKTANTPNHWAILPTPLYLLRQLLETSESLK